MAMEEVEKEVCAAMEKEAEEAIAALKAEKPNPRLALGMLKRMEKADGLGRFVLMRSEVKALGKERQLEIIGAMEELFVTIEGKIKEAEAMIKGKDYGGAISKIKDIIDKIIQQLGWESQLEKAK
ncbi:hypothetical protein KY360_03520 [Candidatus Woesearchaeota archaeon]|nr:hypothetical protein [Candidatus Woesearchaeota archaeon]